MTIVFFLPLLIIGLAEAQLDARASRFMQSLFDSFDEGEEDDPENQNPKVENEDGSEISKMPFDQLVKDFPDSHQSMEASILAEIKRLSDKVDLLKEEVERNQR